MAFSIRSIEKPRNLLEKTVFQNVKGKTLILLEKNEAFLLILAMWGLVPYACNAKKRKQIIVESLRISEKPYT